MNYLEIMLILQYYAVSFEQLQKIEALAELLNCEYRITENIIVIEARDHIAIDYLSRAEISPFHTHMFGSYQS